MGPTLQRESAAVARSPWIQRRRIVWIAAATVIAALSVLGVRIYLQRDPELDCQTVSRNGPEGEAVIVCQREYERTKVPMTGARYADALRRSNNVDAAVALANQLLNTDARGTALQILGKVAEAKRQTDEAISLLQQARQDHRTRGEHVELAKDDQVLARIQDSQARYAEALETLEECITQSRAGGDERIEGYCHLTAARVLMTAGYFEAAQQEIDRAAQQLRTDADVAQLWYGRGNLEQEVVRDPLRHNHYQQAVVAFEKSLELSKRARTSVFVVNIHLNLAYSLAEVGRTEEADQHLSEAALLDVKGRYKTDRDQIAARIAYRRENFSLASSLNEKVFPTIEDDDDRIFVCIMQARIALAMNDMAAAIRWAKLGVDSAERVRGAQTLSELRPWVLASRRQPFELLFTAYARTGRVEDAVAVFDQWQGRTLLDEMARPSPEPLPGLSTTASRIQGLGRWLPAVSKAPLMTTDGHVAMRTLGRIDLVALAVAEREVWRLTAIHGQLRLDDLGSFDSLSKRLDQFMSTPTDPAVADELGKLLLPDDVVRTTTEPLYVVLDPPLAALPFVALRRNAQPLIAIRPVIRAPRLPVASTCGPREAGGAHVLADAAGDLPDARRESSKVASLFGTTPLVGAAATSAALFAAKSDPVLHVAVHAEVDAGGGMLKLHDRAVSAPEISANRLGPSLVVLSACSTARSSDPELAGSLSTAFLAGGSQRVVATLRPVSDAGALDLTSRFYNARGADDPVRALAQIQAMLAQTDNKEWPNFAVFTSEVCLPGS
ncbi:MAG: CHAT domain-containing protein [Deltaproteobacteria bacterium]|nr:MAG: CHAT domain-containing protein [Deltaproteobacteria bacterium]